MASRKRAACRRRGDMALDHRLVALIPARMGSERCKGKNTRPLAGVPLVVRAIRGAFEAAIFDAVVVSTDDPEVKRLSVREGASIHCRKSGHAVWDAPDVWWVKDVMAGRDEDIYAILRPTSPFRTPSMIRRGYAAFVGSGCHSLRAVRPVTEHPAKMWRLTDQYRLEPIWPGAHRDGTPWHSSATQTLPAAYVQTGGLEYSYRWVLEQLGSITGVTVAAMTCTPIEGVDINTEADFALAERLMACGGVAEQLKILRGEP